MSSAQGRELAASEPYLYHHNTYSQQESWLLTAKNNSYTVPRAYMPFYEVARVSGRERHSIHLVEFLTMSQLTSDKLIACHL